MRVVCGLPLVVLATFWVGCSSSRECSDVAVAGLSVVVVDSASGARICDASVSAQLGSKTEPLERSPGDTSPSCAYFGAYEEPGTYVVRAERAGFITSQRTASVPAGECHVITQQVTFMLTAE